MTGYFEVVAVVGPRARLQHVADVNHAKGAFVKRRHFPPKEKEREKRIQKFCENGSEVHFCMNTVLI